MAVGDYNAWNWVVTNNTGTVGTYTLTGNVDYTAYNVFGIDRAKPVRRAVSVQWRHKDKRMPGVPYKNRGNGWVELDTVDSPEAAARLVELKSKTYPAVEWRIEPSE